MAAHETHERLEGNGGRHQLGTVVELRPQRPRRSPGLGPAALGGRVAVLSGVSVAVALGTVPVPALGVMAVASCLLGAVEVRTSGARRRGRHRGGPGPRPGRTWSSGAASPPATGTGTGTGTGMGTGRPVLRLA